MIAPSELPVNVVIEDHELGIWRKDAPGIWIEVSPLIGFKPGAVFDHGSSEEEKTMCRNMSRILINETSDQYFKDFAILSVPIAAFMSAVESDAEMFGISEDQMLKVLFKRLDK